MDDQILISDEEDQSTTPLPSLSKRPRIDPISTILISDSDPTPPKKQPSSSTPLFVPDTPLSAYYSVVKCTFASNRQEKVSGKRVISLDSNRQDKFSGKQVISLDSEFEDSPESSNKYREPLRGLESRSNGADCIVANDRVSERTIGEQVISLDSEFEDCPRPEVLRRCEPVVDDFWERDCGLEFRSIDADVGEVDIGVTEPNIDDDSNWMNEVSLRSSLINDTVEVDSDQGKEDVNIAKMGQRKQVRNCKTTNLQGVALPKKKLSMEEKKRALEEKKLRKEQEKLEKAALKAEEAERKKLEKEKQKWEKGKLALQSIVAVIDTKVIEGSFGGFLLSRFSEKGITVRVASNPIERSIVWTMNIPEDIAPLFPQGPKIPYVLLIYEAEDFCNLVANERFLENISKVQDQYPSYTVCCLTNKLMSYVKKKEKEDYKNPGKWRRPPIDEVLAKLTTHYVKVHSRHCIDEAEVAEHVVGLTSSLASCQFRKKLTMLSVNANGAVVSKDSVDKHLIKKSPWLKALVAIPKVQPRFAMAVWKKYPSMKSLFNVYMNPNISVHEKEFLLKDLKVEGLVGAEIRLGEVCSKRIYRVLMSPSGAIKTDDVENGAAFFAASPHQGTAKAQGVAV